MTSGDVDFGYTGDFKGLDCRKIDKTQRATCAKDKFFFHCKNSKGKSFCTNKPTDQDKLRQDFYRKLVIESCENDSFACSRSDRSGEPKEPDDMCVYVNVCDDGMPASHILPTIRNTYSEYKAFIDEAFGDWESMAKGDNRLREYRKQKAKRIKTQMDKIKSDYNENNGYNDMNETNVDDGEFDEGDDQFGGRLQFGGDDDDFEDDEGEEGNDGQVASAPQTKKQRKQQEEAALKEKFSSRKTYQCESKVKGGKDPFKKALKFYYKFLRERNALKDLGFSLSTDKANMDKAGVILQGKVQGYKKCLDGLSAGSYSGLQIFKKYVQLEEDLAKLKNRKSIKRLGNLIGSLKSKYKSVKAQRQAFTDTLSKKPGKLSEKISKKLGADPSKYAKKMGEDGGDVGDAGDDDF